jgi:predicted ester cyclase
MSDANKQTVRAYVEAFNAHDMARMRRLFVEQPEIWGVLGHGGLDVVEPIWRELHESLEMKLEIVALAAEGEVVVARLRETGRFIGQFRGLPGRPPTGRSYEIGAIEWFEFQSGRIARRFAARDSGAITRQVLAG